MKMALLLLVSDTFLSTFILVSLTWNKPRESCLVPDVRHPQWKYEYSAHPHQPPVTGSVLAARSSHQITIQDNWVAASAAPKPRHQTPRLAQGYLRITRHGAWMQPPPIRAYKKRTEVRPTLIVIHYLLTINIQCTPIPWSFFNIWPGIWQWYATKFIIYQ